MNHGTSLLLFDPAIKDNPGAPGHRILAHQLGEQGFVVSLCADLRQLPLHIQGKKPMARGPAFAILNASHGVNCAAASSLRALQPTMGVVALVDSFHESILIQTLQSGADTYCSRDASVTLLKAALSQLRKRIQASNDPVVPIEAVVPPPSPKNGQWFLLDQAWKLASPAGLPVFLTTSERAFMVTLFNAPGMRASHTNLIQAINTGIRPNASDAAQSRLGVMVSRMRNKFRREGIRLPLKSLHNWGYMFTEAGRFQDT